MQDTQHADGGPLVAARGLQPHRTRPRIRVENVHTVVATPVVGFTRSKLLVCTKDSPTLLEPVTANSAPLQSKKIAGNTGDTQQQQPSVTIHHDGHQV